MMVVQRQQEDDRSESSSQHEQQQQPISDGWSEVSSNGGGRRPGDDGASVISTVTSRGEMQETSSIISQSDALRAGDEEDRQRAQANRPQVRFSEYDRFLDVLTHRNARTAPLLGMDASLGDWVDARVTSLYGSGETDANFTPLLESAKTTASRASPPPAVAAAWQIMPAKVCGTLWLPVGRPASSGLLQRAGARGRPRTPKLTPDCVRRFAVPHRCS